MNPKHLKIAAIILGLTVGIGSIAYQIIRASDTVIPGNPQVTMIDISTGETFIADRAKKAVMIPEKNPVSGEIALVRIFLDEAGTWKVADRDMSFIGSLKVQNMFVDAESGAIKASVGKPKRLW